MRSPANGSVSCGRVATSNLGYKKDAFLEPSLVATTSLSHQITNHSYLKHYQLNSSAMSSNNVQQSSGLSARAPGFNPRGGLTGPGVSHTPVTVVPGSEIGRAHV